MLRIDRSGKLRTADQLSARGSAALRILGSSSLSRRSPIGIQRPPRMTWHCQVGVGAGCLQNGLPVQKLRSVSPRQP